MRVLIVEDDSRLLLQLDTLLQEQSFTVDLADDGEKADFLLSEHPYDAVILDIGLPKRSGLDVVRAARKNGLNTPILILTARDRWQDKVEGLDAGADDYLTKPFQNEELIARLKALIRRAYGQSSPIIQYGPIALDSLTQDVSVNSVSITLTAHEYRIVEYFFMHPDKVISKSELIAHVYDQDFDLDSNVIEVFIGRLRKKLDPDSRIKPFETLRGRGYRLALSA